MSRRRPALLLPGLASNVLISSGTFLVAKRALEEFPPLTLALLRFCLATALLWPSVRLLRREKRIRPEDRGQMWWLGLLAVPLNQGLFLYGMKWASASHAALLYALTPAFVVLFVTMSGGPRPTVRQVLGVAIAFAGVLTLLLQRGLHFDRHSVRGDLLVFLAVVAWAGYLLVGRGLTRRYGPLVVTSEALLAGTLLYLPVGLAALPGFQPSAVSWVGWVGLFYLAWLTSGVNYVIWFWGLEHLKPGTVAMLTNVQPVVTAGMAWLFLREALPAGFALSTALVLGGVWLTRVGEAAVGPPAASSTAEPAAPTLSASGGRGRASDASPNP